MIRFESFTKSFFSFSVWSALSVAMMLAAYARPATAQSFDAGVESKMHVGVNVVHFGQVAVGETSDAQTVVITTNVRGLTLNNIDVKEPFIETGCTCVFVSNNVSSQVDCSEATLAEGSLDIPPATTCKIGVAFQPQSNGKVDKRGGVRIDSDARNSPRRIRLIGFGVGD